MFFGLDLGVFVDRWVWPLQILWFTGGSVQEINGAFSLKGTPLQSSLLPVSGKHGLDGEGGGLVTVDPEEDGAAGAVFGRYESGVAAVLEGFADAVEVGRLEDS